MAGSLAGCGDRAEFAAARFGRVPFATASISRQPYHRERTAPINITDLKAGTRDRAESGSSVRSECKGDRRI